MERIKITFISFCYTEHDFTTLADLFDYCIVTAEGTGTRNCVYVHKSARMSTMCRRDPLATISCRVLLFYTAAVQNDLVVT
jgi:hypothetical protein